MVSGLNHDGQWKKNILGLLFKFLKTKQKKLLNHNFVFTIWSYVFVLIKVSFCGFIFHGLYGLCALHLHAIPRQGGRSPSGYHKICDHSTEKEAFVITREQHSLSGLICSYMIKNISSITDLSLYYVLFKVFCLIWDPEHSHRKGQIQHHLLKTQTNRPAS